MKGGVRKYWSFVVTNSFNIEYLELLFLDNSWYGFSYKLEWYYTSIEQICIVFAYSKKRMIKSLLYIIKT